MARTAPAPIPPAFHVAHAAAARLHARLVTLLVLAVREPCPARRRAAVKRADRLFSRVCAVILRGAR